MTVTYTLEVSQVRFINLVKLLLRWRGSVYKLMFKELLSFLFAYYLIAFTYRHALDDLGKRRFENFSNYCREFLSVVPITFILGFYLSFVANRWWNQYLAIPWPDKLAIEISAYIQGTDERGRMIRRSLVRYLNLISCLTFQYTSTIIKKRFPTLDHLVSAGIMTHEEKIALESTPTQHGLWWIPAQWFAQLVMVARKEGRIHDDLHVKTLIDSLTEYRGLAGSVWSFDWISVPLSYTQVVAIAVYSFFVSCLFGRQYLYISTNSSTFDVDFYIPVFTIFQFLFYVGWLKVGEAMICPFGEDDDDFNLNWIIDRNIQVGYLIVDQMYRNGPKPQKDALWDEVGAELPYTNAAFSYKTAPFFGSTQGMDLSEKQSEWTAEQTQMPPIDEETAIGFRDPVTSFNNKLRRKLQPQKLNGRLNSLDSPKEEEANESENELNESLHSSEGEEDQRSNSSIQYDEEKNNRGRLPGLIMGVSRHTLGSRFGSKQSLNSRLSRKRSSTSKFSFQRSPPSSSIAQPKSIPNSRQRLNKTKKSRGSSPVIYHHRDGIPDYVLEENKSHSLNKPIDEKIPKEKSNSFNGQSVDINSPNEIDKSDPIARPTSLESKSHSNEEHKITLDSTSRTPLIPVEEETR